MNPLDTAVETGDVSSILRLTDIEKALVAVSKTNCTSLFQTLIKRREVVRLVDDRVIPEKSSMYYLVLRPCETSSNGQSIEDDLMETIMDMFKTIYSLPDEADVLTLTEWSNNDDYKGTLINDLFCVVCGYCYDHYD